MTQPMSEDIRTTIEDALVQRKQDIYNSAASEDDTFKAAERVEKWLGRR